MRFDLQFKVWIHSYIEKALIVFICWLNRFSYKQKCVGYDYTMTLYCHVITGAIHRIDGPAVTIEHFDGTVDYEWWIQGMCLGENERGMWKFWNCLTTKQKNNLKLLSFISKRKSL